VSQKSDLVCVISDLGPGGAQRVLSTLVNAWARRGRRISVITFSAPADDFFRLAPEVDRISIRGLSPSNGPLQAIAANFSRIRDLRRALAQSGATTVLAFLGATNVLSIIAAAGLGLRVVISERNDPRRQSLGRVWDILRRRLYRYAHVVTANSHGAIAAMDEFVPRDKLKFVANPVGTMDSSANGGLEDDADDDVNGGTGTSTTGPRQQKILHIGRLTRQKGQDILLQSFARITQQAPHWRLAIIGEGEEVAMLQGLADRLNITGRVEWLGRIADPTPHYMESAIFALPSRFEGTPNVLLEAMSAGLPTVVTDASSGPLEYIEDGKTGLVVPKEDASALAQALLTLIEDGELRAEMGDAAKQRVGRDNVASVLKKWDDVLQLSPTGMPA
jgi:GalNAc-alpha-(1->4)-GalNAc-alpha-(1->3)-diNAcBac-PP-undecaprenol alpha-1,4-N-acetyl-D-galactosaminyltransferase